MRINREEIFSPVASVIRVKDYDEALAVANGTGVRPVVGHLYDFAETREPSSERNSEGRAWSSINLPTAGIDYHAPFGGTKGVELRARANRAAMRRVHTSSRPAYVMPLTTMIQSPTSSSRRFPTN